MTIYIVMAVAKCRLMAILRLDSMARHSPGLLFIAEESRWESGEGHHAPGYNSARDPCCCRSLDRGRQTQDPESAASGQGRRLNRSAGGCKVTVTHSSASERPVLHVAATTTTWHSAQRPKHVWPMRLKQDRPAAGTSKCGVPVRHQMRNGKVQCH